MPKRKFDKIKTEINLFIIPDDIWASEIIPYMKGETHGLRKSCRFFKKLFFKMELPVTLKLKNNNVYPTKEFESFYVTELSGVRRFCQTLFLPVTLQTILIGGNLGDSFIGFTVSSGLLPQNLKGIEFLNYCRQEQFKIDFLPKNLSRLKIFGFTGKFRQGVLPESLLELEISEGFNQILEPGVLPNKLRKLKLGQNYDREIAKGVLPESLRFLHIGWDFSKKINSSVLPDSLETLILDFYEHSLEIGDINKNLLKLKLGNYAHPVKVGTLHDGLVEIYLGRFYSIEIVENALPNSLRSLTVGQPPNLLSGSVLPDSLQSLHLVITKKEYFCGGVIFPKALLELEIEIFDPYTVLKIKFPENLKCLTIIKHSFPVLIEATNLDLPQSCELKFINA